MSGGRSDSQLTPGDAFKRAVAELGGQSATARELGVSQQAISAKLKAGKGCSPKWALPLAKHSKTSVSEYDLAPDLYPREAVEAAAQASPTGLEPVR